MKSAIIVDLLLCGLVIVAGDLVCPENEEFTDCSPNYCKRTCQYKDIIINFCVPFICEKCICKEGYFKNEDTQKCVKPEDCPVIATPATPVCGENERYISCGAGTWSSCIRTCLNPDDNFLGQFCINDGCPKACFCKPGYIVDVDTQKCIKPEDCPV